MPEQTTDAPNLPSTAADGAHVPSTDVPDDPAAAASAEIYAAMNGSTLADDGDGDVEYPGAQAGIDQQVGKIEEEEPAASEAEAATPAE